MSKKAAKKERGGYLPSWKTTYMFMLFCEQQSNEYVARQSGANRETVARYRKRHHWDERLANIKKELQLKPTEEQDEELRRQALQQVRILRSKAFEAAMNKEYRDAKDAGNAFIAYSKHIEELLGNHPPTTINLIILAAEQFQAAQKKLDPSKRVPAEIMSSKDSDDDEHE